MANIFGQSPDAGSVVSAAYANLLDREGDVSGLSFWTDLIIDGSIGLEQFLFLLALGTAVDSQDRQTLDDQVDIGLYFSALSGLSDRDDGTAALDIYDVNNRDTTLSAAKSLIDGFVADIENGVDDGVLLLRVVGVIDDPFAVA